MSTHTRPFYLPPFNPARSFQVVSSAAPAPLPPPLPCRPRSPAAPLPAFISAPQSAARFREHPCATDKALAPTASCHTVPGRFTPGAPSPRLARSPRPVVSLSGDLLRAELLGAGGLGQGVFFEAGPVRGPARWGLGLAETASTRQGGSSSGASSVCLGRVCIFGGPVQAGFFWRRGLGPGMCLLGVGG